MISFLKEAAAVRPSKRQMDWFDMDMYAFIHFSPNTYTDSEWGSGSEDASIFNPEHLDCDQWAEVIRSAGMKGMILTAKHHDGFCLWPSKYTEHSVKNSPCGRDVVREAAQACRRGGIKFGLYLSPWDRNAACYGTPAYNDYFCNQLTELLTEYGDIFCVWFDNACGEGPNGKKQEYDFARYVALIREYQPGAVIFNDYGPDVRWCGNEAGHARHSEWAVVPHELCRYADVQTSPGPLAAEGDLSHLYNTHQSIGAMPNILYSEGLCFVPSEINMSIRPGWFWHPDEKPRTLKRLFDTYLTSVGANACLHINLPPNRDGLIDGQDALRMKEFGDLIKSEFGSPVPCSVKAAPDRPRTQPAYKIRFEAPQSSVRYIVIEEDLNYGQRIESFYITADTSDAAFPIFEGTCVGHRKICVLCDPFAGQNPLIGDGTNPVNELTLHITAARDEVHLRHIAVYQ